MQQIIGIVKHDQMTCLADGLRKLETRDSKLRTPGILFEANNKHISIQRYNITAR